MLVERRRMRLHTHTHTLTRAHTHTHISTCTHSKVGTHTIILSLSFSSQTPHTHSSLAPTHPHTHTHTLPPPLPPPPLPNLTILTSTSLGTREHFRPRAKHWTDVPAITLCSLVISRYLVSVIVSTSRWGSATLFHLCVVLEKSLFGPWYLNYALQAFLSNWTCEISGADMDGWIEYRHCQQRRRYMDGRRHLTTKNFWHTSWHAFGEWGWQCRNAHAYNGSGVLCMHVCLFTYLFMYLYLLTLFILIFIIYLLIVLLIFIYSLFIYIHSFPAVWLTLRIIVTWCK